MTTRMRSLSKHRSSYNNSAVNYVNVYLDCFLNFTVDIDILVVLVKPRSCSYTVN